VCCATGLDGAMSLSTLLSRLDTLARKSGDAYNPHNQFPPLQPQIDGNENIWIAKPARYSKGKGIVIFRDFTEFQGVLANAPEDGVVVCPHDMKWKPCFLQILYFI
jgi:hypothetical protein